MTIQAIDSSNPAAAAAAAELAERARVARPRCVVYFASSRYDQPELARAMRRAFPEAALVGCSTAGEIVSGKMLERSLVAMVFDADALADVAVTVVEQVHEEGAVARALARLADHVGASPGALDVGRYVGLVLVDGLSRGEEKLMDAIGNLTDVAFIGGSAGDDLAFARTYVHADGQAYTGAAVLALLEPVAGFDILKTQSFEPLAPQLVATSVDEATRTVLEFDHQPAATAYATALGIGIEQARDSFMSHPLGLMVGDEPYIRSPQQIQGGKMIFYCHIKHGAALRVMRSTDIVADTRRALASKRAELGQVAAIINFHCILRTLELTERGQADAYGELFAAVPTIGFSTYGEQYIGHINQTSTMLLFR